MCMKISQFTQNIFHAVSAYVKLYIDFIKNNKESFTKIKTNFGFLFCSTFVE